MEEQKEAGAAPPWDDPDEAAPARRNGFAGEKKRKFLKRLAKTGCIADACRAAGISRETAYAHRRQNADFARRCDLACSMAATSVELEVWQRAVVGVEEPVYAYGKLVGTRLKRSDNLLRILLQGSNRKKYGPQPQISRPRLLKAERKRMEKEAERQAREQVANKVKELVRNQMAERESAGAARKVGVCASDMSDLPALDGGSASSDGAGGEA